MTVALAHITFDCVDATSLAGFWSHAIGIPVDDGAEPSFASIGYPAVDGKQAWLFIKVPEGKSSKNRMHLDLTSGPDGRDTEVARLVGAGATKLADHDEYGHRWTVMHDPEGNEFCVA